MKPCEKCPWIHEKEIITPALEACAIKGSWFCCHVNMGTCFGAQQVGAALKAKQEKGG